MHMSCWLKRWMVSDHTISVFNYIKLLGVFTTNCEDTLSIFFMPTDQPTKQKIYTAEYPVLPKHIKNLQRNNKKTQNTHM